MKLAMVLGLAMTLLLGGGLAPAEQALQGTWELVAGEANGQPLSEQELKGGKLVIDGDHYTVTLAGMETTTGVQKLDPTARQKTIDITDSSGPHRGQTCYGIYELEGDEFHVTFAPPGQPRPSSMTTQPGSDVWLHVWKRVKE